jgi:hypothetical protein
MPIRHKPHDGFCANEDGEVIERGAHRATALRTGKAVEIHLGGMLVEREAFRVKGQSEVDRWSG